MSVESKIHFRTIASYKIWCGNRWLWSNLQDGQPKLEQIYSFTPTRLNLKKIVAKLWKTNMLLYWWCNYIDDVKLARTSFNWTSEIASNDIESIVDYALQISNKKSYGIGKYNYFFCFGFHCVFVTVTNLYSDMSSNECRLLAHIKMECLSFYLDMDMIYFTEAHIS